jgi:N-acetylglucosaminyldiphosphoundecaprenol N-acetyl-beta-D-mannosaminyltransferase
MTRRIELMGCLIDNLSMEETLQKVEGFIQSGRPHQHVVVNVDKLCKAAKDAELRRIINACPLISVDGMPVLWVARLLGKRLKERVTGIDLFQRLVERAAEKGWRVFFLGARREIVHTLAQRYQAQYPALQVAGYRDGYWSAEEEPAVAKAIAGSRADLLFVAISSPHKERFLASYQALMNVPFAMGVGGSFDVVVGKVKRAPRWMQRSGLEWFYRFLQEPRRMFRRYFIDDSYLFWLVLRELVASLRPQPVAEER